MGRACHLDNDFNFPGYRSPISGRETEREMGIEILGLVVHHLVLRTEVLCI